MVLTCNGHGGGEKAEEVLHVLIDGEQASLPPKTMMARGCGQSPLQKANISEGCRERPQTQWQTGLEKLFEGFTNFR